MAFKLSKAETERKAALVAELEKAWAKVEAAREEFNAELEKLAGPVAQAVTDYNDVVTTAREWAQDIASQAQSDIDDKSERWQEGERGTAAIAWKDEYENVSLDGLEVDDPDPLTIDDPEHASTLEALPEECDA